MDAVKHIRETLAANDIFIFCGREGTGRVIEGERRGHGQTEGKAQQTLLPPLPTSFDFVISPVVGVFAWF
jgi:hypothetical protein